MLFTRTPPTGQDDRVYLHVRIEAARNGQGPSGPLFRVAVTYDDRGRRLVPLTPLPPELDPRWTTPAQQLADGTIIAKAPIPATLFADHGPDGAAPGWPPDSPHGP